jgi:hypothetical protein
MALILLLSFAFSWIGLVVKSARIIGVLVVLVPLCVARYRRLSR